MKLPRILFELLSLIFILVACSTTPEVMVVTAPQESKYPNRHERCSEREDICYVNQNPRLIEGYITRTTYTGRNTDIPEGFRLKVATDIPPFIYCYDWLQGCQFEFHRLEGAFGLQVEDLDLYEGTPYMIKVRYTVNANCSEGDNCSTDMLGMGAKVFVNSRHYRLPTQPIVSRNGQELEASWAFRLVEPDATISIQVFMEVQWAVFAEPARLIIHEIGVIALPDDFDSHVFPLGGLP